MTFCDNKIFVDFKKRTCYFSTVRYFYFIFHYPPACLVLSTFLSYGYLYPHSLAIDEEENMCTYLLIFLLLSLSMGADETNETRLFMEKCIVARLLEKPKIF